MSDTEQAREKLVPLAKTQRRREQQEERKELQAVDIKLALLGDLGGLSEYNERAREMPVPLPKATRGQTVRVLTAEGD